MWNQTLRQPHLPALLDWQGLRITPGLHAVTGDEGSGKTRLLQALAGIPQAHALWLDMRLPDHDEHSPPEVWATWRARWPHWDENLRTDLTRALDLDGHLDKRLFMLSTGSRRKVALVGLLASGAAITCLDQPYAALDLASIRVLREFLADMAEHPSRAWVVADYEADPSLPWASVMAL